MGNGFLYRFLCENNPVGDKRVPSVGFFPRGIFPTLFYDIVVTHVGPSSPHHTTKTMFAANFKDRDDADGTPLSSAAAGGEGGVDADRGFTPYAAAVPSFDATAAVGEEGMAAATTYDDDDDAGGGRRHRRGRRGYLNLTPTFFTC